MHKDFNTLISENDQKIVRLIISYMKIDYV